MVDRFFTSGVIWLVTTGVGLYMVAHLIYSTYRGASPHTIMSDINMLSRMQFETVYFISAALQDPRKYSLSLPQVEDSQNNIIAVKSELQFENGSKHAVTCLFLKNADYYPVLECTATPHLAFIDRDAARPYLMKLKDTKAEPRGLPLDVPGSD